MIENVVGPFNLPLGLTLNFVVNGREVLVPMAIEEPSVVAGASFLANLARAAGGSVGRAGAERPTPLNELSFGDFQPEKRREALTARAAASSGAPPRAATHNKGIM